MKFLSVCIALSLIVLTICEDCSSFTTQATCTGSCTWTTTTAASCTLVTCSLNEAGDDCTDSENCDFTAASGDISASCASKATSCTVNEDGNGCISTAGCSFTAATGTCSDSDSDGDGDSDSSSGSDSSSSSDSNSDSNSSLRLKNSIIVAFLIFLF